MNFRWIIKILGSLIVVIALMMFAGSLFLSSNLQSFLMTQKEEDLKRDLKLAVRMMADSLSPEQVDPLRIQAIVNEISRHLQCRVTILSKDGRVWGDSALSPERVNKREDFSSRPEILEVKTKGYGQAIRFLPGYQSNTLLGAMPIKKGEVHLGYVRLAFPLTQLEKTIAFLRRDLYLAGGLTILLAVLFCLLLIRSMSRPLGEINDMVQRMGKGDFKQPFYLLTRSEFSELAASLQNLSSGLGKKIEILESETGELATLLSSMREGVLVTDEKGRIILINPFLKEILGAKASWKKRSVQEIFMSADLQDAVETVLKGALLQRLNFTYGREVPRNFDVQVVALASSQRPLRAVALFHENTELRHLLKVRQTFVANASWELGTPLTSLGNQLDALLPSVPDESPDLRQGLQKIRNEVTRLNLLVSDLVDLAKLDAQEKSKIHYATIPVKEVLSAAVGLIEDHAAKKMITLKQEIENLPEKTTAFWEKDRVVQALANVLDNAIKYTPAGGRIRLEAKIVPDPESEVGKETDSISNQPTQYSPLHRDFLEISVEDTGPGIPKEHLPRIFERFYRVDRARSRELGGTGLGLAIVKHILESHGGTVEVQSSRGKGTTFILRLPIKQ